MELTAGGTLGRYRLLERAGAGGMAEVWKAVQPSLDRIVAIKVLPRNLASDPGYIERFRREARAISRLDHPNILGIHDFGEDDGYTYMVMPFLAGGTLARNLGRPWSVLAAVRILEPLAAALDYAHARGIVHRDVKPSNVLIGEGGRVILGDFGIARMTEGTLALSAAGAMIGTPAYMSPEQVQGTPASPASDQYSLGIVAYEMLTSRCPFEAETPIAVALAHVNRPLPPPRTLNPAIPLSAERVLFKALAKEPADRYPTVSAFVTALAEAGREQPAAAAGDAATAEAPSILQPPPTVRTPPPTVPTPPPDHTRQEQPRLLEQPPIEEVPPPDRRSRLYLGVAASVVIVVCAAVAYAIWGDNWRPSGTTPASPVPPNTPVIATRTTAPAVASPKPQPAPVASPSPRASPSPSPAARAAGSPSPSPAMPAVPVRIDEVTSTVARGSDATLRLTTRPGARCDLEVVFVGGSLSAPQPRLATMTANGLGLCAWTWRVTLDLPTGTWRYRLTVTEGMGRTFRELPLTIT